jgi:glucosamine--fructose-6-phosphate aminotransferase (isomerizing)
MAAIDSQLSTEIAEQPDVLRRLVENERETIERVASTIHERAPCYVVIAARGTSDNAARYGKYLFGAVNGLPVALATPSLFTLYKSPPNLERALVIGISQSGASPDIVSVVEEGRRQGALTLAITNNLESALAAQAEHVVCLRAGEEKSVAATKTYTASLVALAMLSTSLARDDERWQALRALPDLATEVIDGTPSILRAVERYRYMETCVVVGRGYNYATAFEIALKLKELTYVLADPYSPADFQHGPVALIEQGFPVMAIAPQGRVTEEMSVFLGQLQERQAELIVISPLQEALARAQTPLPLPVGIPEWLSPLIAVMPGQIFALGLTLTKGFEPDHPRGLRKVTLTR